MITKCLWVEVVRLCHTWKEHEWHAFIKIDMNITSAMVFKTGPTEKKTVSSGSL